MSNKTFHQEKKILSLSKDRSMFSIIQNKNFTAEIRIHISIKCIKAIWKERVNVITFKLKVNSDLPSHISYQIHLTQLIK